MTGPADPIPGARGATERRRDPGPAPARRWPDLALALLAMAATAAFALWAPNGARAVWALMAGGP